MEEQHTVPKCVFPCFTYLAETLLLALSVTGLWQYIYYLLAPWIWRQNMPFKPEDITPWMLKVIGQDGIEIYALYILVFFIIAIIFKLFGFAHHINYSINIIDINYLL